MEGGISVPVTMNLTEYRQCTSNLITYNPISTVNKKGGNDVMGVLALGAGLISLLSESKLGPW